MSPLLQDRLKVALLVIARLGLLAGLGLWAVGKPDLATNAWAAGVIPVLAALLVEIVRRVPGTAPRHNNGALDEVPLDEIAPDDLLLIRQADVAFVVAMMDAAPGGSIGPPAWRVLAARRQDAAGAPRTTPADRGDGG